jgi:DNA-binding IscR family transcriptional regulator
MTTYVDPTPGVRCLAQLSAAGESSRSADEIARCEGMELSVVREVLTKLSRAGLIESRGACGGFRLARAESSIHVGDVQSALSDGDSARSAGSTVTLADLLAWEAQPFEDEDTALAG